MGIKDVQNGKYRGKVVRGAFGKVGEKETPAVAILFSFNRGNDANGQPQMEQMWWKGFLTENAIERTLETLATLGYDENKGHLPDMTIPLEYFDQNVEVELVINKKPRVDFHTKQPVMDKDGKQIIDTQIDFVNRLGGSVFGGQEPAEIKNMLASLNLKQQMMVARQKLGIKAKPAAASAVKNHAPGASNPPQQKTQDENPPSFDSTEEVPF